MVGRRPGGRGGPRRRRGGVHRRPPARRRRREHGYADHVGADLVADDYGPDLVDVPLGRHEPDQGEINCAYVLDHLDRIGYAHWVGAEYRPAGATLAGLGWARAWGITSGKG